MSAATPAGLPDVPALWKRYPAYRESGLDWLGEIPADWRVAPVYARYDVQLGKMLDEKRISGDHLAPYLRNVDVQWDRINTVNLPEMDFSPLDRLKFRLVPDDILVCEGGEVGRAAIWNGQLSECYYQKALHRLRQRTTSDAPRFMYYVLLTAAKRGVFIAGGNPNTIDHLTAEKLRRHRFPFPSAEEQQAIAEFLDRETDVIDALIEKKERLIALLLEKRAALISRAVTRGLDPAAPMKDSGIGWLGAVPAHWSIHPLRRVVARVEQGWSPVADDRIAGHDEWAVIKLSAVHKGAFRPEEHKALPDGIEPDRRYELRTGDFLLTRANTPDLVGDVCVVEAARSRLMLCDLVYRLTLDDGKIFVPFLACYLLSSAGRYQITRDARGSSRSMVKVSQGHILSWMIALPGLNEQRAIVNYLQRETEGIDTLVGKVREHIDRLREYRAALISAAVTGKIDVRAEGT